MTPEVRRVLIIVAWVAYVVAVVMAHLSVPVTVAAIAGMWLVGKEPA